ncbi:sugar phosphate isomerase/epimerase [Burkholderia sp. S171]|uniref:sugar phosphate isomerase/epimerase family protein n=1 Tax=Burkholderia sp. S171 TaxID=1641860 RepID=UPI00131C20A6|nr:TIM barrel protein [Burkholderia sp. S171]
MTGKDTKLLAAFWTIAGDTNPDDAEWISPDSLAVRAEAASNAGWKGIGLSLDDCRYSVQKYGATGVRRILKDNGLEFFELEILMDWYTTDDRRKASDRARREFLEFGGELGMCNLKVGVSHLDLSPTNHSQMADEFGKLCDDFGTINATVGLEFMPFCKVASLADALPIVQGSNRENGGLIIDIWHVVRSGTRYEDVAAVPANLIKGVELNDANASAIGTLMHDSVYHRKACGEGEFNCPSFIDAVKAAGFHQKYWGVEILSDFLRKASVDVRAKHAFDTTIAQFNPA